MATSTPGRKQYRSSGIALVWAALLPWALLLAGPWGTRMGLWDFGAGLVVVLGGGATGLFIALAGAWTLPASWRSRNAGALVRAGIGLFVAIVPALLVGVQLYRGQTLPAIHDISTDLDDPPAFESVELLGAPRENLLDYQGGEVARQQRAAYRNLDPLLTLEPPEAAFARAHAVATELGWDIVEAAPQEGRIEAVATTRWFRFKDDVIIRIRRTDDGSRIDLRSVSRVGRSDLGANADRIRAFLRAYVAR
ncbi:MAG: DUF1499 domain-containing protein [Gammaproteobacteria bacterium]|nr:DUF1499 domain-containing protein [Gammaproteobacteria bacterium]